MSGGFECHPSCKGCFNREDNDDKGKEGYHVGEEGEREDEEVEAKREATSE